MWTDTGEISNVDTEYRHQRKGYARALYCHTRTGFAQGIFHTVQPHRTQDGAACAAVAIVATTQATDPTIDSRIAPVDKYCGCYHCRR